MAQTQTDIWNKMIDYGYQVRKSGADGQKSWQQYKNLYSNYVFGEYANGIPIKEDFIKIISQINYRNNDPAKDDDVTIMINGEILNNNRDTDHFIIQHFRIPLISGSKLPVVKLAQVAYNAGQAKAVREHENIYSDNLNQFYRNKKLDNLSTYIDQSLLNLPAQNKQVGGYDISKYKYKYLQLKKLEGVDY